MGTYILILISILIASIAFVFYRKEKHKRDEFKKWTDIVISARKKMKPNICGLWTLKGAMEADQLEIKEDGSLTIKLFKNDGELQQDGTWELNGQELMFTLQGEKDIWGLLNPYMKNMVVIRKENRLLITCEPKRTAEFIPMSN